jgi:hypothetical protein
MIYHGGPKKTKKHEYVFSFLLYERESLRIPIFFGGERAGGEGTSKKRPAVGRDHSVFIFRRLVNGRSKF